MLLKSGIILHFSLKERAIKARYADLTLSRQPSSVKLSKPSLWPILLHRLRHLP